MVVRLRVQSILVRFDTLVTRYMPRRAGAIARWLMLGIIGVVRVHAAEAANSDLERKFSQTVRPFLASYCIGCHTGSTPAAQFDLPPYSTMAAVVRDYPHWSMCSRSSRRSRCRRER